MFRAVRSIDSKTRQTAQNAARKSRRSRRPGVEGLEDRALLTTMIGLTNANTLETFDSATPTTLLKTITLTGVPSGENIIAVTNRPSTGSIVLLGDKSDLFTVNLNTGAITRIGSTPFTPSFVGSRAGLATNPTSDTLRLVTDSAQNIRLNPNTGATVSNDTILSYVTGDAHANASPNVVGLAYTNNAFGATSTTPYGIDADLGILARLGSVNGTPDSPNTGKLTTIGSLGVSITDTVGFTIINSNNTAYAALTVSGQGPALYTINLTTGAATKVGTIGAGTTPVISLAASVVPAPPAPVLSAASDSGVSNSDHITNSNTPVFTGTALSNATVRILANGIIAATGKADANGNYSLKVSPALADGNYTVMAEQQDGSGLFSTTSAALSPNLVIKTSVAAPGTPSLFNSDSGFSSTDNYTRVNNPAFFGTGEIGATAQVFANGVLVASGPVQSFGQYAVQTNVLPDGTYQITANQIDVAGNVSVLSATMSPNLTIDTSSRPTPAQAYVNQVFKDLAGRSATQAEIDKWAPVAFSPNGRLSLVQSVTTSAEYRQTVVRLAYQNLLHRTPETAALISGANYLVNHSNEQLRAILAGQGEYIKLNGGTNLSFIQALYRDFLHRPIDATAQNNYLNFLNGGGLPMTASLLVVTSPEANAVTSTTIFQTLLHRTPDAATITNMTSLLNKGGTDQDIVNILASSLEYYQNAHGSNTVLNQWASQIYLDTLNRAASPAEVTSIVNQLNAGFSTTQVVQSLQSGTEYRTTLVNQAYQTVLRRKPDAAGLTAGLSFFASGGSLQNLEASLYGSQEYFIKVGGTNAAFVSAIYGDILGRPVDSASANAALSALSIGATRTSLAASLLVSPEGSQRLAQSLYLTFLRRVPSFSEQTTIGAGLASGSLSYTIVIANLLGSGEYFAGL